MLDGGWFSHDPLCWDRIELWSGHCLLSIELPFLSLIVRRSGTPLTCHSWGSSDSSFNLGGYGHGLRNGA
jgi:hypothetical protein